MKKPPDTTLAISAEYRTFIESLKVRVTSAAFQRLGPSCMRRFYSHTL
jgi:hypothetical protein